METTDRKGWTEEEDNILTELVHTHGTKKWVLIAKEFNSHNISKKTGKQCRERWHNNLNPRITKDNWTKKEEKILFQKQEIYGNKWSMISAFLKGRTDNATKNHFYSIIRKNIRRHNKKKPQNERISIQDIQELLHDPEARKILLKKPRHYHNVPRVAKKTESSVENPEQILTRKRSGRRESVEESELNELKRDMIEAHNKSKASSPSTSMKDSNNIRKPCKAAKPEKKLRKESLKSLAWTALKVDLNNIDQCAKKLIPSIDQSCINTPIHFRVPTRKNTIETQIFSPIGVYPNNQHFFFRNGSRNNSVKSIGMDEFTRVGSRKNSEKATENFGQRGISRKNSLKGIDDQFQDREHAFFPPYSPKFHYEFHSTPRNLK